jgi:hypothetical protein
MKSPRGNWKYALLPCAIFLYPNGLQAVVLTAPEFSHPVTSEGIGLRARYSAFANVFGDTELRQDALTKLPSSWSESISFAGSVAAVAPPASPTAFAEFRALSQVARLSGFTHVKIEDGVSSANTEVYMQFMDVIRIGTSGMLDFKWAVSGTVDEERLPFTSENFASSSARAEFFVWPFGTVPTAGLPFNFTNYGRSAIQPDGDTHLLPATLSYPAGSRWWVLGQMTVRSAAIGNDLLRALAPETLESTGRLDHTAQLFIDPNPATPDATYTSLSGFDYHTAAIPEASRWWMFLAGLGLLGLRFRRSRQRGPASRRPETVFSAGQSRPVTPMP